MLDSYLGIVSTAGLHELVADHAHTRRFLFRRIRRFRSRPACGFWIVLPREIARDVRELLAIGERIEALRLVENNAHDMGALIPDSAENEAAF